MAFTAARMYYEDNRTMDTIARDLGVSRSTVSRLLRDARADGMVRISLQPPEAHRLAELAARLEHTYGITAQVIPAPAAESERHRLRLVAAAGARRLEQLLGPDMTVGLAWGTTVTALAEHLSHRSMPGVRIVQLNGAINTQGTGLTYVGTMLDQVASRWDASVHHFPVPAFFDHPATRQALWRERSVRRVLDLQSQVHLAVFGVGAFDADVPSHVYTTDYITDADQWALHEDGAVGDVCTVMLRADGTWRGIRLNERSTGPTPEQLARVPRRLLVAAGPRKATALRAALRARVATDLVVDETTALRMLSLPT